MKPMRLRAMMMAGLAVAATAAQAQQIVTLTPASNQRTVLAALRPGDTLRITGTFAAPVIIRNRDFGNVRVDAGGALFQDGLVLVNVHNLAFTGGTYGRADRELTAWHTMRVDFSSNISMAQGVFLGNSDQRGGGLKVAKSNQVTVRDSQFSGHGTALSVGSSTNVLLTRNNITGSTGDGINVVDSQRVIVSSNSCSAFVPGPGAHPDCVQLWSLAGRPLQSDIAVINNSAIGNMQAFVSFDPRTGSGSRLIFAGNYAAITYVHGVSCTRCTDSIFEGNVLSNLPGSRWGAPSVRLTEGTGNSITNNQTYDVRLTSRQPGFAMAAPIWSSLVPSYAALVGSQFDNGPGAAGDGFLPAAQGVPEPATWALMGMGFALVGRMLRRRTGPRLVMA